MESIFSDGFRKSYYESGMAKVGLSFRGTTRKTSVHPLLKTPSSKVFTSLFELDINASHQVKLVCVGDTVTTWTCHLYTDQELVLRQTPVVPCIQFILSSWYLWTVGLSRLSIIRCFEQHQEVIYSCTLLLCLVCTQHYGQITHAQPGGGIPICLFNHSKLIISLPEKR